MRPTSGDAHDIAQAAGVDLAEGVVAPANNRSIGCESEAVEAASSNCDYAIACTAGDDALVGAILAPGNDCSVRAQCQAMIAAGGDGGHAGQIGRWGCHIRTAPLSNRAVAKKREAE